MSIYPRPSASKGSFFGRQVHRQPDTLQTCVRLRPQVGGGGMSDALQMLTTCVPFWAALAGTALSVTHSALPATLAAVVPPLASAHLPLALLTAGAAVDFTPLQQYQLRDVGLVLGARLLPPLLAGAAAALLAPPAWLPLICVLVLLLTGTPMCLSGDTQSSAIL